MLAELRRAHYGYVLALHLLPLCAGGRSPTEIAAAIEDIWSKARHLYNGVENTVRAHPVAESMTATKKKRKHRERETTRQEQAFLRKRKDNRG